MENFPSMSYDGDTMSLEQPTNEPAPSRLESLLDTAKNAPELFTDLEASMLFLEDYPTFVDTIKTLGKTGRTFELIFSLDDPDFGTDAESKRHRMRQCKAALENTRIRSSIASITVKGKRDDPGIDLNSLASGVKFVEI